jgi:hypothetical protein
VKKTAVLQLLYVRGVLKKGRLSSDDECCKASGLARCLRASVGKPRFRILLNCLRLAVKESITERTGGGVTNTDNYCTRETINLFSIIKKFVNFVQLCLFAQVSWRAERAVPVLTLRLLMSYIYGAPILDVSRSHTTTQHSR